MQETRSEARNQRVGGGLEERFQSATPTTRYEYVDVFFETAGVDVPVAHSLRPQYPDQVNYEVVQVTAPALVYHDGSASRRGWLADTIFLRCNVSTVWARIRVSLPSDETGLRQGSVNAVDPGATFIPDDLAITGDLAVLGAAGITGAVNIDGALDVDAAADIQGALTTQAGINNTGGTIAFPAVQVPSADANTLDDYEEGTWTPVLRFGGASVSMTFTDQQGTYIKVGRLVVLQMRLTLSAKGSSTGTADISGIPFAPRNASPVPSYVGAAFASTMNGLTSQVLVRILANGSLIGLFDTAATGVTTLDDTNFNNTSNVLLTLSYFADA